ncbi:hypothetical protein GOP47_0023495 [Adiantum capillus-veneris]|uniref:Uncharacterized protein n=1 Tax=Adiantum capillus-veneris TaxID=13818 RepID=A0A9D4U4L3_ADICA|nr:hypothetical protein GOP47_0023495 [Adiantum capillus-veneris]
MRARAHDADQGGITEGVAPHTSLFCAKQARRAHHSLQPGVGDWVPSTQFRHVSLGYFSRRPYRSICLTFGVNGPQPGSSLVCTQHASDL